MEPPEEATRYAGWTQERCIDYLMEKDRFQNGSIQRTEHKIDCLDTKIDELKMFIIKSGITVTVLFLGALVAEVFTR